MMRLLSFFLLLAVVGFVPVRAQEPAPISPTAVSIHGANTWAFSDAFGLMAIGTSNEVVLYRLSNTGEPTMAPLHTFTLPAAKAPAPAGIGSVVYSIAFHPRLPLLYVWQTYVRTEGDQRKVVPEEVYQGLPSLVVYHLAGQPKEVGHYTYPEVPLAGPRGMLALNEQLTRLHLPSSGEENPIRWVSLNAQGLPLAADGTPAPVELFGVDGRFIHSGRHLNPGPGDTFLVGAHLGIRFFDVANRVFGFHPLRNSERIEATVDPSGQRVYLSYVGGVSAMGVVDGRITGLLRHLPVEGKPWPSVAVVMPKRRQLAVSVANGVRLIDLDAQGWPVKVGEIHEFSLPKGRHWLGLHYSPKFDRLYVPVTE